jgi:hypothetical protein
MCSLESEAAMPQIHWLHQVSADFSTAGDWGGGIVPGPGDDAILDASGATAYAVTASTSHTVASVQTAAPATLAVTGGTFDATAGTGGGANGGTVKVDAGATFEFGGSMDNPGLIAVAGATSATLEIAAAGATLSGSGQVTLGGGAARIRGVSPTATLTNVDNSLSGSGHLGANSLTFVNQAKGLVEAAGGSLILATAGETVTNAGMLEAAAGGILVLAGTTVDDTGGGAIQSLSGGRVDLQDADIEGGTLAGPGAIVANVAGGMLDGSAGAVSLTGVVVTPNGMDLTIQGAITGTGKINLDAKTSATDLIIGAAGATLSGGGQVNLTSSTFNRIIGASGAAVLTNAERIAGGGQLGAGELTLVNQATGLITNATNSALVIDTGATTIVNAGVIATSGAGGTTIDSAVDNTGVLRAANGTLTINGAVTGSGSAVINDGVLAFNSTYDRGVTFSGASGTLVLAHSIQYGGPDAILYGFVEGNGLSVDLKDISFNGNTTLQTFPSGATLVLLDISDGVHSSEFYVKTKGTFDNNLELSADGSGGTLLTEPGAASFTSSRTLSSAMASFDVSSGWPTWSGTPIQMHSALLTVAR